jgi:mRNA-degrading endonuclease RelE of RelBE toxin-antitoxin system
MFQVVFNEISAAEISRLDTLLQLELLAEFKVTPEDIAKIGTGSGNSKFGLLERDGKKLYRYRAKDYRFYFQVTSEAVQVHRVLHKNTFQDFLLRNKLPVSEDEALSQSKTFWKLIHEAENARKA